MVVEELLQSFISVVDTQLLKCIELKGNEIENDSEFLNEKYVLHVPSINKSKQEASIYIAQSRFCIMHYILVFYTLTSLLSNMLHR